MSYIESNEDNFAPQSRTWLQSYKVFKRWSLDSWQGVDLALTIRPSLSFHTLRHIANAINLWLQKPNTCQSYSLSQWYISHNWLIFHPTKQRRTTNATVKKPLLILPPQGTYGAYLFFSVFNLTNVESVPCIDWRTKTDSSFIVSPYKLTYLHFIPQFFPFLGVGRWCSGYWGAHDHNMNSVQKLRLNLLIISLTTFINYLKVISIFSWRKKVKFLFLCQVLIIFVTDNFGFCRHSFGS